MILLQWFCRHELQKSNLENQRESVTPLIISVVDETYTAS